MSLNFFSFCHFGPDSANSSIKTSSNNNSAGFSSGNVGTRKDDIFLILVNSTGIRNGLIVFNNGNGFTSQNRLINSQGSGHNGNDSNIGRDFVTNGNFNDVSGNNFLCVDFLHAIFVSTDNFAHFGLVFLEGFDSRFSIAFLPDTDNGIGYQDEQNNKRLDKCGDRFIIVFKERKNKRDDSGKQQNFD